jgi:hypothetical protein
MPKIAPGLEIHETDDGMIVFQESTDRVHHLNPTAAVILQLCDGSRDVAAISAALAEAFGLSESPLDETHAGIEELSREGMIL